MDPDSSLSDYETWTPTDDGTCLLGHQEVFIRKKPAAQCVDHLTVEEKIIQSHCDCTMQDYECDFGFAKIEVDAECIFIGNHSTTPDAIPIECQCAIKEGPLPPLSCAHDLVFDASIGYRVIAGDTCQGGLLLNYTKQYPCPGSNSTDGTLAGRHDWALVIYLAGGSTLLAIGVLAGIGLGYWIKRKREMALLVASGQLDSLVENQDTKGDASIQSDSDDKQVELDTVKTKEQTNDESE